MGENIEDLKLVYTMVIVIGSLVFYIAANLTVKHYGKKLEIRSRRQTSLKHFLQFSIALSSVFFLTVIWGFEIKNIWVFITSFIGIFGVALFASWSFLSNVVSSFILYFTVPFRTGDHIEIIDGDTVYSGNVADMTLFFVYLKNDEGRTVIIPNNIAMLRIVTRKSRTEPSSEGMS